MSKKIIVSVISDLVTDQRVLKQCHTLHKTGYAVLLIGRQSGQSFGLKELPYTTIRFYNPFSSGLLMYLVFNTQLFFYLLFKKSDILWSNDLDTLLPNYLISRFKNVKLIYDSHEYFTESVIKSSSKRIWMWLESKLFPQLKNVITVNNSIREVYEKKYGVRVTVIRNVPYLFKRKSEAMAVTPPEKKILLMQGRGINENRGAEEAIMMMQYLPGEFILCFLGSGTIIPKLKSMVQELKLTNKVNFKEVLPYPQMMNYTSHAYLGLIFEKIEVSDEHRFSLPNKFFDYLQAGIPVLSSQAVEIESLIRQYNTGDLINNFDPKAIAEKIITISNDDFTYHQWKQNTERAANELNWENEENILIDFMNGTH